MTHVSRRTVLATVGGLTVGSSAGCLGNPLGNSWGTPQLVGIVVGNWHPKPQTVNVRIEGDNGPLFDRQVPLPGGDPADYQRPAETLDGFPSELPPSATLSTWVAETPVAAASTLEFGDRGTDCIGVEVDICPVCSEQKGQGEITVPDTPDTLLKTTSSCTYPG